MSYAKILKTINYICFFLGRPKTEVRPTAKDHKPMSKMTSFEKYQKRRLRSSYLSVVVSIALVLFLLGLLGLLIFHTKNISNHFKEKYAINIFIKDSAKEIDIENLKKILQAKEFTKTIKFVSKDQALEIYKNEVGEDFMEFLGENPLKSSIDLFLK